MRDQLEIDQLDEAIDSAVKCIIAAVLAEGAAESSCPPEFSCSHRCLYQYIGADAPRDSDIDTIPGSFLLHLLRISMQILGKKWMESLFAHEILQDFVSLNQMLNLLPNG